LSTIGDAHVSEPDPGWRPQFDGQREPFPEDNTAAVVHGATSPRTLGPLAAQFEATARASSSWPDYLRDPAFGAEVTGWAWSEAQVILLRQHVAGLDLAAALADTAEARRSTTATRSRRTRAAVRQ